MVYIYKFLCIKEFDILMDSKAYGLFLSGEVLGVKPTKKDDLSIVRVDDGNKTYEVFCDVDKLDGIVKGKKVVMSVFPTTRIYNGAAQLNWNCREFAGK